MNNPFMVTKQRQTMPDMRQAIADIKAHPKTVLGKAGYNIPDDMTDGQQIVNYLLQSGQVSNARLQGFMKMLGR